MVLAAASLAGVPTGGLSDASAIADLPNLLARGWLGLVVDASIGYAGATLTRSQLAGIAIGIGIYFGEQFSRLLLPDIVRYFPFTAVDAMLAPPGGANGGFGQAFQALDPTAAVLVVVGWLVVALVVSSLAVDRAEISG
jgi:hypothetical protein